MNHGEYKEWKETVTKVEQMDAIAAIEEYGNQIDILIMSWPYMDDVAYRALRRLHEVNSSAIVVYIGEGFGGCTANDNFFDHFEEIEDEYFNSVKNNYQRWFGIYDKPMIGRFV
ncbi:hypothetical protein F4V43_02305 [Paenibacillus spiritus]|uniref:Uncharacterized protein n=1 Tax=Paenibacillus spiritus TaxID=2496557 RepID=A0A5J5GI24_9BACL|nr:hypothetical protein [Paenibacillus spiritus]KAA9007338.1 hypothetical protein F4V43_02305 [Paenibacillus spiritus]